LAEATRIVHVFATRYAAVDGELPELLATKPDIILLFGVATRRRHLCIETRARNAVSVLFPDVGGYRPRTGAILYGASNSLRGNVSFADLFGALRRQSFPARLSRDAGRYLCNYAYWQCLRRVHNGRPLVQFVHIPPVRFPGRRASQVDRHPLAFHSLLAAAETLLVAMLAASRR